jgi:hypothetical protein
MPSSRVPVALIALALVGCGTPGRAPPPYFAIPAGPVGQNRTPAQPASANSVLIVPSPNPDVQTFIQPHEGEFMRGPAPVQEPSRTAVPLYAQPPNIGPITGYGPGGMAQPPGAPPNPPYPRGGLFAIPGT